MSERNDQASSPLVSFVTPSYNHGKYIRDTIESIRNQTYDNIEHIVVDGGSDDGTVEILREYDHLEWRSEPDRGETHAVNEGFERADGDILCWINADDAILYRDAVANVVRAFQRTDADVVYGHSVTVGPDNEFLRVVHSPSYSSSDQSRLPTNCYWLHQSVFVHSSVVEVEKLDERWDYLMDLDFYMRLGDEYQWHRLDDVLGVHRKHPDRKSDAEMDGILSEGKELLEDRGFDLGWTTWARVGLGQISFRMRRLWGLPLLVEVLRDDDSRFAIDFQRRSVPRSLRTQFFRHGGNPMSISH